MFRAILKLTYFPGAPDIVLPECSELRRACRNKMNQ